MILLISPYANASACATHIERVVHDTVTIVNSMPAALATLRKSEFAAVVADDNLLESSPGSFDALLQRMAAAIPVILDVACLRPEKIAKHVLAAIQRRAMEAKIARQQATEELRGELKSDVTGLLLSSEILLKSGNMSPEISGSLRSLLEISRRMKARFED
jgi:hypothetical protein